MTGILPVIWGVNAETGMILSIYPTWYFNGSASGENMGSAVSAAGDVNGDGKPDVLVGSQKHTLSLYREGAAFVFYSEGGGLSEIPDWTMGGGQQGSMFGCALSSLGDVNGDGFDDIVVGACEHNDPVDSKLTKTGAAYAFYGANNFAEKTSADWELLGDQAEARLGSSVSGYYDEHKDISAKFADVLVGIPNYDSDEKTSNGKVSLFSGSETGLSVSPIWEAYGDVNSAMFGSSVDSAGDVNGDGYFDIIVGAPKFTNVGSAHLFYNSITGIETTASWKESNDQSEAGFGAAVAGIGDVNRDGFDDVLVGAPNTKIMIDALPQSVGCVYLYLGSTDGLATSPAWTRCADQPGGKFGASVAAAGDTNQDGYDDFLVGMPFYSISNEKQGAVYLFFGNSGSIGVKGDYFESTFGNKSDTEFGTSVSNAGDVNNDGRLDVIVGAPNYKASGIRVGRVMTYYAGIAGIPDEDFFQVYIPIIQK